MSRVINPDNSGKERTYLTKSVVKAIRALMQQTQPDQLTRDLAAYIAISLLEIDKTVDVSVQAWEKRGYWLKADRFRLEWEWAAFFGAQMSDFVKKEDWAGVAMISAKTAQKLSKIKIAEKNRLGEPWIGARSKL